jgi:hypothetical protein
MTIERLRNGERPYRPFPKRYCFDASSVAPNASQIPTLPRSQSHCACPPNGPAGTSRAEGGSLGPAITN